jgi:hypothetical protein
MKIQTTITLDQENYQVVKDFCDKVKVPFSSLLDAYISGMAMTIKFKGLHKKERLSKLDFMRLAAEGVSREV